MDPTNPRWMSSRERYRLRATLWKIVVACVATAAITTVAVISCLDRVHDGAAGDPARIATPVTDVPPRITSDDEPQSEATLSSAPLPNAMASQPEVTAATGLATSAATPTPEPEGPVFTVPVLVPVPAPPPPPVTSATRAAPPEETSADATPPPRATTPAPTPTTPVSGPTMVTPTPFRTDAPPWSGSVFPPSPPPGTFSTDAPPWGSSALDERP